MHLRLLHQNRRSRLLAEAISDLERAVAAAANDTDTNPTDEQKQSGNYRKGHVTILGLPITIETPKGATRSGKNKAGKAWSITMKNHYGYIKRTESEADGDHIDIFIGPDLDSEIIFIVDQETESGIFDEHKVLVGLTNAADAKAAYLSNYSPGWKGFGGIVAMTIADFKDWIKNGETGIRAAT